ncbi:hypothetical protein BJX70DRAFT_355757 [Aspergillus crustosus]
MTTVHTSGKSVYLERLSSWELECRRVGSIFARRIIHPRDSLARVGVSKMSSVNERLFGISGLASLMSWFISSFTSLLSASFVRSLVSPISGADPGTSSRGTSSSA